MDRQFRIERRLYLLHRAEQLAETLEREKLALQGHENRVRRRKCVDCQKVERRGAIDEDITEIRHSGMPALFRQFGDRLAKAMCPVLPSRDLELDAEQVHRRRRNP